MKIIHTADIHLDSPLSGVKDSVARRHELLVALDNMSEFANNNGVEAIIVAGDLFDDKYATDATVASVANIVNRSRAVWFVLRGNHAGSAPYDKLFALCPQIRTFGSDWTSYALGDVVICGRELGLNDAEQWTKLALSGGKYRILTLHGDIDDNSYGFIDKRAIAQSGADYVALGHRHSFAQHMFGNVKGCYCGVLETRGFDESAPTGFVLIDTQSGKISFVQQACRKVVTRKIDVSACDNDIALQHLVGDSVADVSARDYLNVQFVGTLRQGIRLSTVARQLLDGRFFALRIADCTETAYDLRQLASEVSLRGEFVKLACNEIQDKSLRDEVIKFGLSAIDGEISE